MGLSGKSMSDVLTTMVMFVLLFPSCTTVVNSDVAATLLSKALTSRMRESSLLALVPKFIRLNTSLIQLSLPLNKSVTFTTNDVESLPTASTLRLAMSGFI